MDELAEGLPEGAELRHVTLVAVCDLPDIEDGLSESVYLASTTESRLEQVGSLSTAASMAMHAPIDEE
jgi:hypothetical protein